MFERRRLRDRGDCHTISYGLALPSLITSLLVPVPALCCAVLAVLIAPANSAPRAFAGVACALSALAVLTMFVPGFGILLVP